MFAKYRGKRAAARIYNVMKIHFIGCQGVSMRELMELEKAKQNIVTGSDINLGGHRASNVHGADLVVYTCAVGEDNPELAEARLLGIPVIERAQLLGQLAATYSRVTAIAGAHGKTTATGMTAAAMRSLSPTVHIGGEMLPLQERRQPCDCGSDCFVTEACEYRRSFLQLKPDIGAVLNVDLDHTDYYKDLQDITDAYSDFVKRCSAVLINCDDAKSMYLSNGRLKFTFGLNGLAHFRGVNLKREWGNRYSFDFCIKGVKACRVIINQPGFHNVYNALCAMSLACLNGVDAKIAAQDLQTFNGIKRRFESVGSLCGAQVISDYAHHPKELRATLASAKKCTDKKVFAVFQPHTYTRTRSLEEGFADALSAADEVVVMPIFAAREAPIEGVTSHNIVLRMMRSGSKAVYIDTFCEVLSYLKERVEKDDIVLFLGAGDVDALARDCGQRFLPFAPV